MATHWLQSHVPAVGSRNDCVVRRQDEVDGERDDRVLLFVTHVLEPVLRRTLARVLSAEHVERVLPGARVLDVAARVEHSEAKVFRDGVCQLGDGVQLLVGLGEFVCGEELALVWIARRAAEQRNKVLEAGRASG